MKNKLKELIEQYKPLAYILLVMLIIFIGSLFYLNFNFNSEKEKKINYSKIIKEDKNIDVKLRNIKLDKKAKALNIPQYHIKSKDITDYSAIYLNEDEYFIHLKSKRKIYFRSGSRIIKISRKNKYPLYFANNKIYKRLETK